MESDAADLKVSATKEKRQAGWAHILSPEKVRALRFPPGGCRAAGLDGAFPFLPVIRFLLNTLHRTQEKKSWDTGPPARVRRRRIYRRRPPDVYFCKSEALV
jgi:hypothetical protein